MRGTNRAIRSGMMMLLLLGFAIIGCQKESAVNSVEQNSKSNASPMTGQTPAVNGITVLDTLLGEVIKLVIPANGATLQVRTCTFNIQPGALTLPTLISFSLWKQTPPPGLKNAPDKVFKFFPGGLVFSRPSVLIVPFSELGIESKEAQKLMCYWYDELARRYVPQPTHADMEGRRFIVKIKHFSQYAFGRVE